MKMIKRSPLKHIGKFLLIGIMAVAFSLSGCSIKRPTQKKKDGPPKYIPANLHRTPNAVPKIEPLSRYGNRFKKGTTNSYTVFGKRYHVMPTSRGYKARGTASWYGTQFHGRKTSNGEKYDMFAMTGAHRSLPLPTYARVTNLHNGKSIIIKFNDRGPFHGDRLIDLSYVAATKLGILGNGTARVEVESIDPRDHYQDKRKHHQRSRKITRFEKPSIMSTHKTRLITRKKSNGIPSRTSEKVLRTKPAGKMVNQKRAVIEKRISSVRQ